MSRRLSTNVQNSESVAHEAAARLYGKVRRDYIQWRAGTHQLNLTVMDVENIYDKANGISQGLLDPFKEATDREILDVIRLHPEKVRYSPLQDWMNDDMNDQERARREIASWFDNPKYVAFDTETTGLNKRGEPVIHVPVTAAACTLEETSLCDITLAPLDSMGKFINITEGASRANHLTDSIIQAYPPLEKNEVAIISLESLVQDGRIFLGYNTQFDRDMICRAIDHAFMRTSVIDHDLQDRLRNLHTYFKDPVHWLECKDIFVRAIGLDPQGDPGRYTRMEDVARATNALSPSESQEHGALADCQLLARIVRNIRKELENMPNKTPKTAAKGQIPATANPAENEPDTDPKSELKEYIEGLETSLNDLQAQYDQQAAELEKVNEVRVKLGDRVRELENLCEQYQQDEGVKHHEARSICFTDIIINGYPVNFTIREGYTAEAAVEDVFKHIRGMMLIQTDKRVTSFMVGVPGRSEFHEMKRKEQPAAEQPATPKSNGQQPPANKPNVPSPANKPAIPQGNQPAQPTGKVQGAKASQLYTGITRHQIDGQNTYDLSFILNNGKPADKPIPVSKRDTATLEKALTDFGYELESLELGVTYDVKILNEWTWGKPTNPEKPEGPRFHDNATYTVQSTEPF